MVCNHFRVTFNIAPIKKKKKKKKASFMTTNFRFEWGSCRLCAINNAQLFYQHCFGRVPPPPPSLALFPLHMSNNMTFKTPDMNRNLPLDPPLNDRSWRWLMRHISPFGFMKSHSREVRLWRHEREGESNFMLMVSLRKEKKWWWRPSQSQRKRTSRHLSQKKTNKKNPTTLFFQPPPKRMLPSKTLV